MLSTAEKLTCTTPGSADSRAALPDAAAPARWAGPSAPPAEQSVLETCMKRKT